MHDITKLVIGDAITHCDDMIGRYGRQIDDLRAEMKRVEERKSVAEERRAALAEDSQ